MWSRIPKKSACGNMVQDKIYFGRFVSVPTPAELLIRSGAVLVVGEDGGGTIEEVDWEVKSADEAKRKLGGEADVLVVTGDQDGFFFPGFIGMLANSRHWLLVW